MQLDMVSMDLHTLLYAAIFTGFIEEPAIDENLIVMKYIYNTQSNLSHYTHELTFFKYFDVALIYFENIYADPWHWNETESIIQ